MVREIERVLERKLSSVINQDFTSAGGLRSLVDLLNQVDRSTERTILEALDEQNPELADEVRRMMFLFEDIVVLDDRSIQQVLREVDTKELAVALKGTSDEVQQKIYGNMSERAAAITAESAAISPNGSQIAFRSLSSGDDLWVATSNGASMTRLTTGSQSPRVIRWSKKTTSRIYFLNGTGELRYVSTFSLGSSSEPSKVNFQAKMMIRRAEEFDEMFAQSYDWFLAHRDEATGRAGGGSSPHRRTAKAGALGALKHLTGLLPAVS